LPLEGSEGGVNILWNSVLQRFVFGHLNLGNSNVHSKNMAEKMLRVV